MIINLIEKNKNSFGKVFYKYEYCDKIYKVSFNCRKYGNTFFSWIIVNDIEVLDALQKSKPSLKDILHAIEDYQEVHEYKIV